MKTEYWYKTRKQMKEWGLSKNKARSYAWKLQGINKDLAQYEKPKNAGEIITKAILGETAWIVEQSAALMGKIINKHNKRLC